MTGKVGFLLLIVAAAMIMINNLECPMEYFLFFFFPLM